LNSISRGIYGQIVAQTGPLVSVGVPTYNRPHQLAVALNELSAQTYSNIEIIVSDNGSPGHATRQVVERARAADPRIRYTRQEPALSAIQNFRFVLQQSRGEFFMWATDDDRREPQFIETLLKRLQAEPASVLCYSEPYLIENGRRGEVLPSPVETRSSDPVLRARQVLLNQNYNNEICGIFRREALADFDFAPYYGSDHGIQLHAALKGHIVKGPAGLFGLGLGGSGATPEGVIRALGLKNSFLNRYFGALVQTRGLYNTALKAAPLTLAQKLRMAWVMLERIGTVRQESWQGLKRLAKDMLRPSYQALRLRFGRQARNALQDYRRVARALRTNVAPVKPGETRSRILLVALEGMNHFVVVVWGVLTWGLRAYGYKPLAVTLRAEQRNNRLLRLFRIQLTILEDCANTEADRREAEAIAAQLSALDNLPAVLAFVHEGMPLGKFAVSTWCRNAESGDIDLDEPAIRQELGRIAAVTFLNCCRAKQLYQQLGIDKVFCTELNTDSYGGFYLAARQMNLDIVRFASSNRDNAYFLQHMDGDFNSWHHSALAPATWKRLRDEPFRDEAELQDFFTKRYGGAWAVFSRNYKGTSTASPQQVRGSLGIGPADPFAIVFSHILYDTLYFYGDDIFNSYAEWLIETLKAASANPHLTWGIKLHPSNIWRGALKKEGKFEEERLLSRYLNDLPPHVKLIQPDTKFSPLSWMQAADFGITVRGTPGLEMASMGKTVITAGRGRYDRAGFTTDPDSAEEYRSLLARLPDLARMTEEQVTLARQYMHAVFVRKAFQVTSLDTVLATGKQSLTQYNDLLLLPSAKLRGVPPGEWPDVKELARWLSDRSQRDYIA
jgi:glycosyltransferase involved in cell wall biosynthesis